MLSTSSCRHAVLRTIFKPIMLRGKEPIQIFNHCSPKKMSFTETAVLTVGKNELVITVR